MKLAILGASDLGRLIAHHAVSDSGHSVFGFYDNFRPEGEMVNGFGEILGSSQSLLNHFDEGLFDAAMLGIGYTRFEDRTRLYEKLSPRVPFATLVHSTCFVDPSATIGAGSFLLPGCTVDADASIGRNVVLNTGVILAHHATISDHSFLAPAVAVAGHSTVGAASFVGINATIIDNLTLAPGSRIGAGAVVTDDVHGPGWRLGVPAKPRPLN